MFLLINKQKTTSTESQDTLHAYWNLCRVHEAYSKVVFLNNVQMVHDLFKQLLAFGFFL